MANVVTPEGIGAQRVEWKDMLLLEHFAATWGRADGARLGIHCGKCGQDLMAGNGVNDRVLTAKCLCSEFYATRPEVQ